MKTKLEKAFVIFDWAGNRKFPSKKFRTLEDGWDFLMAKFDSDEDLGEFQVFQEKDLRP